MNVFKTLAVAGCSLLALNGAADESPRWHIAPDNKIVWTVDGQIPHEDHIEMSGKQVSVVLRYGVDCNGGFTLNKSMVWPLLRTIPNNTHASLMRRYDWNPLSGITVNGRSFTNEKVKDITLKGMLTVKSTFDQGYYGQWELTREYLPSAELPALVELYQVVNTGKGNLSIEIPEDGFVAHTDPAKGVTGSYTIEGKLDRNGFFTLQPGDTLRFTASVSAHRQNESPVKIDVEAEKAKRMDLVNGWMDKLVLETPDSVINRMFAFSKIRACESIYETQGGPMHGPGGESYYAAIWANDQAEYINAYFPFTGYEYGNASALNSFRHFARFMNDEWKPIPSSIVAEGLDIWNGVGDRGDAAMIAYGASRYALAYGNREVAEELWQLITWCLEYCKRKLNAEGVVTSDTDELENRFLISASYLAKELNKGSKIANTYRSQAAELRKNIEKYFGAKVEGFDTYAYYKGNDILRSWICIPLTVGINERAQGTIDALFSPRLWTENGLLTQAGDQTFWDRSTLYALRGVYAAGETEKATDYLHRYSATRLLGEHVPYAIEAWPEGGQRHLSAESGLYGRIITEGMFGIRPVGFKEFIATPRLPQAWNEMRLRNICAFGTTFDMEVNRLANGKLQVSVWQKGKKKTYTVKDGNSINIKLM